MLKFKLDKNMPGGGYDIKEYKGKLAVIALMI